MIVPARERHIKNQGSVFGTSAERTVLLPDGCGVTACSSCTLARLPEKARNSMISSGNKLLVLRNANRGWSDVKSELVRHVMLVVSVTGCLSVSA